MSHVRYLNAHDANMRLAASIVRYKGLPYVVHEVVPEAAGTLRASLTPLQSGIVGYEPIFIDPNNEELDISSVPLGYSNTSNGPVYTARAPLRNQTQGVVIKRLTCLTPFSESKVGSVGYHSLFATIMGKYPSFSDAIQHGNKAFSRKFALHRYNERVFLGFAGTCCGVYLEKKDSFLIVDKYRNDDFFEMFEAAKSGEADAA